MRIRFTLLLLLLTTAAFADQPMCGAGEEREELARLHHERMRARRGGIQANATPKPATLRDGAFYMSADDEIATGGRLFDLTGHSLLFEPKGGAAFTAKKVALAYAEPGELLHDFAPRAGSPWHYVTYDLTQFAFPAFGKSHTRLYLTAFNEIEFAEPREEGTAMVDHLEAAVHRNAVFSPLMITTKKPRFLAYPQLYVRETANAVFVTWKSVAGDTFGYDLQAELRSDGTVVYSYQSMRNMQWGTPVVSAGFDPAVRRQLATTTAQQGLGSQFGAMAPMLDIRSADVARVNETDVIAVKVTLAGPIDQSKIGEGQTVRYALMVSNQLTYADVTRTAVSVYPFGGIAAEVNGATATISGNTIEFYFLQSPANVTTPQMRAFTQLRPNSADAHSFVPVLDVAPRSTGGHDLSALTEATAVMAPVSEPFVLPALDPFEVWERLAPAYSLSSSEYDAVAIYQSFYTDIIHYAGAYSVGGNPAVNGIAPPSQSYGTNARRHPNLLHMNHFTYNYNGAEETAAQVILHEFGHRWLYFFRILENGALTSSLNPLSAHPAAYVHTPAAFPVFREGESSTMGGAVFSEEGANTFRTKVANRGYSWTDLYLMGLAAPEEVQPWFYLAGTTLPGAYWPENNITVTGEKREVTVGQIIAAHGPRNPAVGLSSKKFKVAFVLVTEPGREATAADVAKMNEWRKLFERTFYLATGGRAQVDTTYVKATRRHAVR